MRLENLSSWEQEQALRLLLHVMEPEQRRRLMAEQPITYHKLFPRVDKAVIRAAVEREMRTCQCGMWPVGEYGPTCPSCKQEVTT